MRAPWGSNAFTKWLHHSGWVGAALLCEKVQSITLRFPSRM